MISKEKFFINGEWVNPEQYNVFEVINPANKKAVATISLGTRHDVDKAVNAAKNAFDSWSTTSINERIALLKKIMMCYERRKEEIAQTITLEMGSPITYSRKVQASSGPELLQSTIDALREHDFERRSPRGGSLLHDEPVGVCGLITPWNWPIYQVLAKVSPAIAAGCTIVLKPSELSPLSAILLAKIFDDAGCPPGVFNLVNGNGAEVGNAISTHPDIDMISFTGSTHAGTQVIQASAPSVKRVVMELGGKSPNLCFADAKLKSAIEFSITSCMSNSGQHCDAPTRLLVERSIYDKACELATEIANATEVGHPEQEGPHIGPVINEAQYEKIQQMIQTGIDEGATLLAGGLGHPEGFGQGYFVRPTVFADANNNMTIAREEIFGPVLTIIPFANEEEAIAIANDTPYGLSAYIQTQDPEKAMRVARKLRAGNISVNGHIADFDVPFGGYKQSGNGRENGIYGLHDFLEVKGITLS